MLEEILNHLHNWFVVPGGLHTGKYVIENGSITLPYLAQGQYFRITGSVFNDGLHVYPASDLSDEEFNGCISELAIPSSVIILSEEIEAWCKDNPATVYTSESFGGYSKTVGTNRNTGVPATWTDAFRGRLNAWRKVS